MRVSFIVFGTGAVGDERAFVGFRSANQWTGTGEEGMASVSSLLDNSGLCVCVSAFEWECKGQKLCAKRKV